MVYNSDKEGSIKPPFKINILRINSSEIEFNGVTKYWHDNEADILYIETMLDDEIFYINIKAIIYFSVQEESEEEIRKKLEKRKKLGKVRIEGADEKDGY